MKKPTYFSVFSDQAVGWNSLGFKSQQGQSISLFSKSTKPALGPTQKPIESLGSAISARARRPSWEVGHFHVLSKFCVRSLLRLHGEESDEFTRTLPLPLIQTSATVQSCTCAGDKPLSALSEYRVPRQNANALRSKVDKLLMVCVLLA